MGKSRKDYIAEMTYGEGATHHMGRVLVQMTDSKKQATLIAGSMVPPLPLKDDMHREMWECEIIIIPRKKYAGAKHGYAGSLISSHLMAGFQNPDNWDEEYFVSPSATGE